MSVIAISSDAVRSRPSNGMDRQGHHQQLHENPIDDGKASQGKDAGHGPPFPVGPGVEEKVGGQAGEIAEQIDGGQDAEKPEDAAPEVRRAITVTVYQMQSIIGAAFLFRPALLGFQLSGCQLLKPFDPLVAAQGAPFRAASLSKSR
jgi:hypothetical protein